MRPTADDQPAGPVPAVAPRSPGDGDDPWPPDVDPTSGASGAEILHAADGNLPDPDRAPPISEALWRALASAQRSLTDEVLARSRRLGPPPWNDARFQVVSSLDERLFHAVVGRDFRIPASPEASLRWFAGDGHNGLASQARDRATAALRRYEHDRRTLVVQIVDRLWRLSTGASSRSAVAYALIEGRLVVVTDGEIPALGPLLDRAAGILPKGLSEARALARRSR